jgi:hypothetical protein
LCAFSFSFLSAEDSLETPAAVPAEVEGEAGEADKRNAAAEEVCKK